jgi:hypothetical protein
MSTWTKMFEESKRERRFGIRVSEYYNTRILEKSFISLMHYSRMRHEKKLMNSYANSYFRKTVGERFLRQWKSRTKESASANELDLKADKYLDRRLYNLIFLNWTRKSLTKSLDRALNERAIGFRNKMNKKWFLLWRVIN